MERRPAERQAANVKAYAAFTAAPDDAIIRAPVVAMLFACHENTIWRMARDGRLPAPLKVSHRITGWRAGDIRTHLRG